MATMYSSSPLPVTLRHTRYNRTSLAALLAVLEAELPSPLLAPRVVRTTREIPAAGLVLYSFMSAQAAEVQQELLELRELHGPSLLTVAGGAHASGDPLGTLRLGFRWVISGEAGEELGALVRDVAAGNPPPSGVIAARARRPLDTYAPWPASGQLFCQLEISRGCPVGCAFCQTPTLHGREMRHRSLAALQRALLHAAATGHTYTRFVAPNAFAYGSADGRAPQWSSVEQLLRIAHQAGMREVFLGSFPSEVRPESVTPDLLHVVRDYCTNRSLVVGMQSGSPELLRRISRGHTVEEGVRAVALIAEAGLLPRVDFIFGLPGETEQQRAQTRQVIEHLTSTYGARVNVHRFSPLPGTPLARTRPSPIDAATRELLQSINGRGQTYCLDCLDAGWPGAEEASPEPEAREASPEPEAREASPEPEAQEASPEPEAQEASPKRSWGAPDRTGPA